MALSLSSSAFRHGERLPRRHTCEGEDISPPLAWGDAPTGTRSFALICADPDAPAGTWYHWGVFDLPPTTTGLPEGYPPQLRVTAGEVTAGEVTAGGATAGGATVRQALNDFRRPGYGGPCPPKGHGTHHYHFHLLALSVPSLPLLERSDCRDLAAMARPRILAEATLTGLYSR